MKAEGSVLYFIPNISPEILRFVLSRFKVRFEEVANVANKRKVVEIIRAATRLQEDMFHLKREVEDDFRRMTVAVSVVRRVIALNRGLPASACSVRMAIGAIVLPLQ